MLLNTSHNSKFIHQRVKSYQWQSSGLNRQFSFDNDRNKRQSDQSDVKSADLRARRQKSIKYKFHDIHK